MAYTTLSASYGSPLTLTAGTYLIGSVVNLNGHTITFDCSSGPIVIKRAGGGNWYFSNVGDVVTSNSTSVNKVYWTSAGDDTVGEIISAGIPSAYLGSFNNNVLLNKNLNFNNWEIRWCAAAFINIDPTSKTIIFTNITLKNNSISSGAFVLTSVAAASTLMTFSDWLVDETNTFSGNSRVMNIQMSGVNSFFGNIIQKANCTTSAEPIYATWYNNFAEKGFSNIYSRSNYNTQAFAFTDGAFVKDCYFFGGLRINGTIRPVNPVIQNCVLEGNGSTQQNGLYLVGQNPYSVRPLFLFNNIITGFMTAAISSYSPVTTNTATIGGFKNNIIFNNNAVLNWSNSTTDASIGLNEWKGNAFFANPNFGIGYGTWANATKQPTDVEKNPKFRTTPSGCVIDTEFAKYIPNTWFVSNFPDYEFNGSDTFDGFFIDETQYTATGISYSGSQKLTPGINYKVSSFSTDRTINNYVLSDLTGNTTLFGGTYLLDKNINLNSYTLTFNIVSEDIIIKRTDDFYFTNVGVVNTIVDVNKTKKVYWTTKDDDTIGDIIQGSTGSPSAVGGSFNNAVLTSGALTFKCWDLRWLDNKQFINSGGSGVRYFQKINLKNCSFSNVVVFATPNVSSTGVYFENINVDSTNTLSGTTVLIESYAKSKICNIYVENATSSNQLVKQGTGQGSLSGSSTVPITNLRIKNSPGTGFLLNPPNNSSFYFENCCTNMFFNTVSAAAVITINLKNCIFDSLLNGVCQYAIETGNGGIHSYNISNCIFKDYNSYVFDIYEYGGNHKTYIYSKNSIYFNNLRLLSTTPSIIKVDYSVYYNNSNETGWTRGLHDISANPQFQNAPTGCVINSNFNTYIPDGYFVGNITDIAEKGSDTFNNLGINEDENTATGYWYPNGKTQKLTPGINYLVDSFSSTPVPQVQLGINLTGGQIGQIIPLTDNSYLVSSFSMVGTQEDLASLRSLTSGTQVIIDLTTVGSQVLNHCSFKDIKVINGSISVLNGEDLGNNEGIIFTTAAENLIIDVTSGNIQEVLTDEFAYNITSFSMQGQNGNLAYLRSKILNSPVTLDLTTVGSQTLTHCSFRDIHVTNGTITSTDGLDLGGNEGITFISTEIPTSLELSVGEEEIMIVQPKLTPYIVTGFSMIGSNGRPATLKSSVEGTPVILDMSSFPISNLEYCNFQDIVLQNGTIVSTNGKDLGGNTGISFVSTEIPEDCVDWKITEELINQLSTMSTGYNTQVKTVQLIESEFKSPDIFPVLIVCPNEIDPDQEYASRNDTLPFALIYIDDSTETNLHYRFRNVPADVQKCLKKNETLNYLAHYVKVDNWENSVFVINDIEFACCIIYVSVERRLDASDPYRLA